MATARIHLITDPAIPDPCRAVQEALRELAPGAASVQLRDRRARGADLLGIALRLREICRARGAQLLVNDRMDVALAAGADGVHLRRDSSSVGEARAFGLRVGVSTHSVDEVRAAAAEGADYVVFGPVFGTPGKGEPLGLDELARACAQRVPVYALGGVDARNAAGCMRAGATGVACIRAVLQSGDVAGAARLLAGAVFS